LICEKEMTMAQELRKFAESDAPAGEVGPLDPVSLAAIKAMMEDEKQAASILPKPKPKPKAKVALQEQPQKPPQEPPQAAPRAADAFPDLQQAAPGPQVNPRKAHRQAVKSRAAQAVRGRVDRVKARVLGYRPTPKHILMASAALLILFRPWLVVGGIALLLVALIATVLILGYDGFWLRVQTIVGWYASRRPEGAADLNRKFDRFAMSWDGFLDRFPEGTVDGLYLPDLADVTERDKRHEAVLDRRLQDLQENEV
jgi:hypothetical protein